MPVYAIPIRPVPTHPIAALLRSRVYPVDHPTPVQLDRLLRRLG